MCSLMRTIYHRLIHRTLGPLVLMLSAPQWVVLFPYIVVHCGGSLCETFADQSLLQAVKDAWNSIDWCDRECWSIILLTFLWALVTLATLPGKVYYGPRTKSNFRPQYRNSAALYYLLTMSLALSFLLSGYSVLHLYYKFTTFAGMLNVIGLAFVGFLYIKGHLLPDPGEHDSTGNPIFDIFCGLELYPNLCRNISLKILIVCRFGLTLWQLVVLVAWKANYELRGHPEWPMTVATVLQTAYLAKAFYWEDGYMQSLDASYDRFGFYTAWGSIAIVPTIYPLANLFFVEHSLKTGFEAQIGSASLVLGLGAVLLGYWSDWQRQIVRKTDGKCILWQQKPVIITAKYTDSEGVQKCSILLASGFWGLARHLNYCFEFLSLAAGSLPALWFSPLPWFVPAFLIIFLVHRTYRDDVKCEAKYGPFWAEYCRLVPYKLLPGVF